MRSRVAGAVLFGLGVLALVFAGGLAFVVAPRAAQLPYDMDLTQSVAEAPSATFLQIANGVATVESGATLRSTVTVQPDTKATANLEGPLDGKALVWLAGQRVERTDTSALVSAYSTSLAVNRKTGAAEPWDGDWLATNETREAVNYTGHMYKFPFGTEKKSYDIFDRDLLEARPAQFVKTEQIEGLETYQFTQEIRDGEQKLPADRLEALLSQLAKGATSGTVRYNNTRTVWVEPTTGQFIKVQEKQDKTLVTNDGRSVVLLNALFTYTDETIHNAAETAKSNTSRLTLVRVTLPLIITVVGLLLIAVGVWLSGRRPRPATAAVPAQGRHAASDGTVTKSEAEHSASKSD